MTVGTPPTRTVAEPTDRVEPRRDPVLLGLLVVLTLASLATTMLGARELLPEPLCYLVGFGVQAMLFALLSGYAGAHAPIRRWFGVAVFASACIYCSFFTYYAELSDGADEARQQATMEAAHARFVKAVFAERKSEADALVEEARLLRQQANDEERHGKTTGQSGYGAEARRMQALANEKEIEANSQSSDVRRLEPLFAYDARGLPPKEVHSRDLSAWQQAPGEWTAAYPPPEYQDYIDPSSRVKLLAPIERVRERDPAGLVALLIAALVDGMAIVLGSAIERGGRWNVLRGLENFTATATGLVPAIQAGLRRGRALNTAPSVSVRPLARRGSSVEVIDAVLCAVHPENGHLDCEGLVHHPDPEIRAVLIDLVRQLKVAPELVALDGDLFTPSPQGLITMLAEQRALMSRDPLRTIEFRL